MPKIVIDEGFRRILGEITEETELCDENGRSIGYFRPAKRRSPVSREEIERRRKEPALRTWAQIREDLEKM